MRAAPQVEVPPVKAVRAASRAVQVLETATTMQVTVAKPIPIAVSPTAVLAVTYAALTMELQAA
jgi:hypothetical protein